MATPPDTLVPPPLSLADSLVPVPAEQTERERLIFSAMKQQDRLSRWERLTGEGFDEVAREGGFADRFEKAAAIIPREELQAKLARDLFVQDVTRATPDQLRSGVPQLQVAKGLFGLTDGSDAAFDGAMKAHVADEVDTRDRTAAAAMATHAAAIRGQDMAAAMEAAKAAAGPKWAKIEGAARQEFSLVNGRYAPDERAAARNLFEIAAAGEGAEVEQIGKAGGFAAYGKADQATRDRMMELIAIQAQAEGKDVEGFFRQMARAMGSGAEDVVAGVLAGGQRRDAEAMRKILARGVVPADMKTISGSDPRQMIAELEHRERVKDNPKAQERGMVFETRPLEPVEREILEEFAAIAEGSAAFAVDAQTAGVKVRPFLTEETQGFWRRAALNAANSLPTMAAAALPYGAGLVAVASSYTERNLSELRRQGGTVTPATETAAMVAGTLEAGIDRLQWFTMGAKLPKLTASVLKWGKPGAVLVTGARMGGIAAAETGQEVVQDLTFPAVQEITAALVDEMPGPDWQGVLTREYDAMGDIFGASLVFGIIGGGGSSAVQYFNRDKLRATLTDREGLALAGYSPETVAEVSKLAEVNVAAAAETLKAAQMETPVDVRQANSAAARERLEADPPPTPEEAALPVLEKRDDGGFRVRYPDGTFDDARGETDALEAVRMWEADDLDRMEQANRELARELEATHSDNPELGVSIKFTGRQVTMQDWAGKSREKLKIARQRVRIAMRQEFLAGESTTDGSTLDDAALPLDAYLILGSSQNFGGAVTRISAEIHKRGNVATVLEEHAEGVAKWLMDSGKYSRADLVRGIRETEAATGKQTLPDDLDTLPAEQSAQAIVEAFSRLAVANAFGKVPESGLSAKFKALFRALKEAFTAIISLAGEIRALQLAGQMDQQFEYWLDVAGGVSEAYQMDNLARAAESELQAAAFEGFPEIGSTLKGRIPHPQTLTDNGHPLAGEVRRIAAGLRESAGSKSAGTRKANEFFLPAGEMADLDQVREFANGRGFDFDTPADMLEALDLSVNYGKEQFGTKGGMESFSVGRASITPTAATRIFRGAGGSPSVIGPATFSIRAFHGTPHKVDRFTTAKIGTGEGQQVFGWGLYFTETEAIAEGYRNGLSGWKLDGYTRQPGEDVRAAEMAERFLTAAEGDDYVAAERLKWIIGRDRLGEDSVERQAEQLIRKYAGKKGGNVYSVTLKPDEADFLDWDAPLSAQSEVFRKGFPDQATSDLTGAAWYRQIVSDISPYSERAAELGMDIEDSSAAGAASAWLLSRGIRGIRYLDGNSRGASNHSVRGAGNFFAVVDDNGQNVAEFDNYEAAKADADRRNRGGSYNYVIFDEADIEIVEENGQPVTSAAGVSFAAVRADSPLLAAIDALAKSPESTAKVFVQMRAKVGEVRERMDATRRTSGFSEEELDPDRFEKLRDLATLEAIAKALPAPIRGKFIGSFRDLEELKTAKGRESYLVKLLPKVEQALEAHLQDQFRAAIRREMQRGAVKVAESKTRGGKIGAAGHMIFEQAKAAMTLTPEAAEVEAAALQAKIEGADALTMDQLAELDARLAAVELFHDYANATATRLEQGLQLLKETYREGRAAWLETLMERRMLRDQRVQLFRRGLGLTYTDPDGIEREVFITDAMRTAGHQADKSAARKISEGFMAAFLSGSQKLRRLGELTDDVQVRGVVEQMETAIAGAESLETDLNLADNAALAEAMRRILGVTTEYQLAKKLRELSEAKGAAPVEKIEGRKKQVFTVPIPIVESLLAREAGGFTTEKGERIDLDDHDLEALQEEWDRFQDLPEEDQGRKRVLSFARLVASGKRQTIGEVSQLEGLQLYLTMRQPDQAKKLERMGYDETTMAELEAWLKPETKALGAWMVGFLAAEQGAVDALHRSEKGVGLRLVDNYFPVRNDVSRADSGGLSLDGGLQQQTGRSVGFIKERVANNAPPAYVNALAVFLAHRAQSNFWKSHVTPLREWGGVLRDDRFSSAVKVRMGSSYYQSVTRLLERVEAGGALAAAQQMAFEKVIRGLMRNFSLGTLGLRMSTLMVNTTAALNAGLEIPAKDLFRGMVAAFKRPESFRDAWNSPSIKRRLAEGSSFEAKLAKSSGPSTSPILAQLQRWAEKGVAPINYVDTGANLLGAASVWEYTRTRATAAGLPDAEARAEADAAVDRLFLRAAQPTRRLSRSELELRALDNPLSALLSLFISEPRKNLAIWFAAGRELLTGKGTYGKAMAVQQLAVGLLVMTAAEYVVRSLYQALAKAEDDEEDEILARFGSRLTDGKAWAHHLATGHLKSIPLAGEAWNQAMASLLDQKTFDSSPNPINKAVQVASRIGDKFGDDSTARDRIEGGIDLVQAFGSAAPGGPIFAQLANVADFGESLAVSNGYDFTPADRRERIKGEYRALTKELTELHGPTGDRKDIRAAKDTAKADFLRARLAPLPTAERAALLEELKPAEAVRERLAAP